MQGNAAEATRAAQSCVMCVCVRWGAQTTERTNARTTPHTHAHTHAQQERGRRHTRNTQHAARNTQYTARNTHHVNVHGIGARGECDGAGGRSLALPQGSVDGSRAATRDRRTGRVQSQGHTASRGTEYGGGCRKHGGASGKVLQQRHSSQSEWLPQRCPIDSKMMLNPPLQHTPTRPAPDPPPHIHTRLRILLLQQ